MRRRLPLSLLWWILIPIVGLLLALFEPHHVDDPAYRRR